MMEGNTSESGVIRNFTELEFTSGKMERSTKESTLMIRRTDLVAIPCKTVEPTRVGGMMANSME